MSPCSVYAPSASPVIYTLSLHDALPISEHAVVALLGLLKLGQVGVEVLLAEEGGAVEALELLARRVVLPVGAGDAEDLERSEEHTSELQSRQYLVCRLLLEKKKNDINIV